MKRMFRFIALLFVLLISGCAASGPKYLAEADASVDGGNLVIYRPYRFTSGGAYANVYIDEKKVGVLKNGGYLKLGVGSGAHTLRVERLTRAISTSNKERIFFRYSHRWSLFGMIDFISATLNEVDEVAAFDELKETKQSS